MFFVYVIRNKIDGRFYVGLTEDVEKRLKEIYLKSGIGKEFIKRYWSGSSVG